MIAQVKTFQKDSDNLEEYEKQMSEWLKIAKENNLISEDIRNIIWQKVQKETKEKKEFIKRNDMMNFYQNLYEISQKEKLIKKYKQHTNRLQWKDISTAYEYISIAEDIIQEESRIKEKDKKNKQQKETIQKLKEKEKQEKEKITDLEKLLNEID